MIQVRGNTLIDDVAIGKIVAPYEGRRLHLDDLRKAAQEIEQAYRDAGYLLVKAVVPPQDTTSGLVEIQVIEGRLGEVVAEGNQRYPTSFLKDRFLAALPEEGFQARDFQRALFLLNELPDMRLKAVLRAGEQEGTTDVVLRSEEDKNYHFGLEYNNFGTRLTGEHRLGVSGDFSSVFTPGDRIYTRAFFATPSDGTAFFLGNYSFPVGDAGTRLGFYYSNGAYTVGQEAAVLDIRGTADIFSFSVDHPLERSLTHSSGLNFRLSYADLDNTILGQPLSNDVYTSASLGYNGTWSDTSGRFLGSATLTRGLGGTRNGDPSASRLGAGADFTRVNLDLARVQEFHPQVLGILRGAVQVTDRPLFSAEQFALGGPDTVRGFPQAEVLGDQAYNTTAEIRWSPLPDEINLFQTVFFVDHGAIVRKRPQPGESGSESLTGAGFGFRVNWEQTRVRLDLGFPLSPGENSRGLNPVIYGQLQTRF